MPYQGLQNGLYLARQKSNIKPDLIYHYGVIDIGNVLNISEAKANMPMVIHQAIPSIRVDFLNSTGSWEQMGRISETNLDTAKVRIQEAQKNPKYDLFGNNCEHFARYVITGVKESWQLQAVVGSLFLCALCYSLMTGKGVKL